MIPVIPIPFVSYHCEKHGDQGSLIGVEVSVNGTSLGKWCIHCFAEMLNQHCCRLTERPR